MSIYVPTTSPDDWQALLADPVKHWRTGFSARSFAHCWEAANGFPTEIVAALGSSKAPELADLVPLMVIPEHKVPLPGGETQSQNDAWVLARNADGLVSIAVEGKVNEPFGDPLSIWFNEPSEGKRERLQFLADKLELGDGFPMEIRYQLIHRTVSAIIEAQRFHAQAALMIVQSFSPAMKWFDDFVAFCALFTDQPVEPGAIIEIGPRSSIPCYLTWVVGEKRFLEA